jgi:predicted Fe-Mo cluster-binding NifX family protein
MMRIAVTAREPGLEAEVDPRFGRCGHFVFVDTDSTDAESVANEGVGAAGGAGVQAAQFVSEKGATAVLTGNCGPNAHRALTAAGVQVIVGVSGTVRDAVDQFKAGKFEPTAGPNVDAKHGV